MIHFLDGKNMTSRRRAHHHIKRKLDFPSYYGKNLDALWDILSTINIPLDIVLYNKDILDEHLGAYGESIIYIFEEAAEKNKNINFKIVNIKRIR